MHTNVSLRSTFKSLWIYPNVATLLKLQRITAAYKLTYVMLVVEGHKVNNVPVQNLHMSPYTCILGQLAVNEDKYIYDKTIDWR